MTNNLLNINKEDRIVDINGSGVVFDELNKQLVEASTNKKNIINTIMDNQENNILIDEFVKKHISAKIYNKLKNDPEKTKEKREFQMFYSGNNGVSENEKDLYINYLAA